MKNNSLCWIKHGKMSKTNELSIVYYDNVEEKLLRQHICGKLNKWMQRFFLLVVSRKWRLFLEGK